MFPWRIFFLSQKSKLFVSNVPRWGILALKGLGYPKVHPNSNTAPWFRASCVINTPLWQLYDPIPRSLYIACIILFLQVTVWQHSIVSIIMLCSETPDNSAIFLMNYLAYSHQLQTIHNRVDCILLWFSLSLSISSIFTGITYISEAKKVLK